MGNFAQIIYMSSGKLLYFCGLHSRLIYTFLKGYCGIKQNIKMFWEIKLSFIEGMP